MTDVNDPIIHSIIRKLKDEYNCHTIVLYGSRARGLTTSTSDYDVIGVCRRGRKTRIARKQDGYYWDVFVYSEKDLKKLSDQQLSWKNARLLYEEGQYGSALLRRIQKLLKKPFKPQPSYEIAVTKTWARKELDRCRVNDIQGLYRRAEFQNALIEHYFFIRQKRFWGPKEGFAWIEENDVQTYKLIRRALKYPTNLSFLKAAASRVYKITLR
jgi:predicted nucleotidyltransferase